jgi:hypothetical protein
MDSRTASVYLSRILSGSFIFLHDNHSYKLSYPNISIKYQADLYAEDEYYKNRFNDWVVEDDIVYLLIDMGIWSVNGDEQLKNIENQIENCKVDLYKNFLNPAKIKSLKKTLSNLHNNYNHLYNIRHSLDQYTLKGYYDFIKNQYILMHSIYNLDNERVFKSLDNIDYNLLLNLSAIISNSVIDIHIYRKLARHELWKSYWSAGSENIFGKPTIDWTDEQKTLVVLTKMYDSAYQHPECPPDSVFEDDDIFDGWMITQKRENEKNRNKNRTEKVLQGKGLDKANEIFIVAQSKEEANNIYDLNNDTSRHIIRERNAVLQANKKDINEAQLPDVQRNLVTLSNEQFKNSRKK